MLLLLEMGLQISLSLLSVQSKCRRIYSKSRRAAIAYLLCPEYLQSLERLVVHGKGCSLRNSTIRGWVNINITH
jgi:hypothetical protein